MSGQTGNANVMRVDLGDEVADLIAGAPTNEAYTLLTAAADAQDQGREMTLAEALTFIGRVSRSIEALGG